MQTKKEHLYTIAAAFGMIRNAVKQVTNSKSDAIDKIVFNSLNKVIARKAAQKEAK